MPHHSLDRRERKAFEAKQRAEIVTGIPAVGSAGITQAVVGAEVDEVVNVPGSSVVVEPILGEAVDGEGTEN